MSEPQEHLKVRFPKDSTVYLIVYCRDCDIPKQMLECTVSDWEAFGRSEDGQPHYVLTPTDSERAGFKGCIDYRHERDMFHTAEEAASAFQARFCEYWRAETQRVLNIDPEAD